MKLSVLLVLLPLSLLHAEGPYPVDPASVRQPGVPKGTTTKHEFKDSKLYPGTERAYWLHVPAQYDPAKPACLMVFQDGGVYVNESGPDKATLVMDNLIAKGEMPVTIGLFVDPGVVPAPNADSQPRFNRSFEYDAFSSDYARFLIDELIPLVAKDYKLSDNPDHRGICGASSGGIAAFNAACCARISSSKSAMGLTDAGTRAMASSKSTSTTRTARMANHGPNLWCSERCSAAL
jgi:enterochelin esterase family protein